jgi:hypothetical protein
MPNHNKQNGSVDRRTLLSGTTAAVLGAGCLQSNGDTPPETQQTQQPTTTATQAVGSLPQSLPTITLVTDGDITTAIGPRGVISDGEDAGAVTQAVFDHVSESDNSGAQLHYTSGTFRWGTMAETTQNGIRITGEWGGSKLQATSDIQSFFKFGGTGTHLQRGPKITYLTFGGNQIADHFLWFDAADETYVAHIAGRKTTESMIYVKPTGGRPNFDNAHYMDLRAFNAGALAIHESADGKCADNKIEACAVNRPNTYGLILRDPVRHEVERFYTGWGGGDGEGAVLIENTPQQNNVGGPAGARQNRLTMIEHENHVNQNPESVGIHIRSQEGAAGNNYGHEIYFPRIHQPSQQRILKVEGTADNPVTDVYLQGLQYAPVHDSAIDLRHAEDCRLEYNHRGERGIDKAQSPPEGVTMNNCERIQFNGVAYNDGDPRSDGEWHQNGSEGVIVLDDANDGLYCYAKQRWWQIAG